MATSEVDICNIALKLLGAEAITSLTEGSDRASLCDALYADARDAVLREHNWNFAQVRVTLARDAASPDWGFDWSYTLPTDPYCLKVNETNPAWAEYEIEAGPDGVGRKIVTNEPELGIKYTGRITSASQYDASFVQALATKLAAAMAYPLTESASVAKEMELKHQQALSHARTVDGQEGQVRVLEVTALVDVRRRGWRVRSPFWTS